LFNIFVLFFPNPTFTLFHEHQSSCQKNEKTQTNKVMPQEGIFKFPKNTRELCFNRTSSEL
jgi:hypothetical protein